MSVNPVRQAKLLEGKTLAGAIREEIKTAVEASREKHGHVPRLVALQTQQDADCEWYLGQQQKLAEKLGIEYERIPPNAIAGHRGLVERIQQLNHDDRCHGIFVALPLPDGFNLDEVLLTLDPRKDVEGVHPASLGLIVLRKAKLIPPTAYAALRLIEYTGIVLRGKKATLVGQSAIVGRPLQLLLGERRVTTVVCNTGTPTEEIKNAVSTSDIVIACAGRPEMIKGDWIKDQAVVIDVGTNSVDGKMVGDVEFERASQRAGFITPVPGGVGPLTVTMLMQNLIHAYKWQQPKS